MKLKLPDGPFDGYIFDCDGTLADSMPLHYRAWREVLGAFELSEEEYYGLGGTSDREVVRILNQRHGTRFDPETLVLEKERRYFEKLPDMRPIAAVVEVARAVSRTHPVAVASGGYRTVVEKTLEAIGIADLFPLVVVREDVERGKPAPDLFLLAARRMEVERSRCLVFEDAGLGLEAASRAGMQAVFVPSQPRGVAWLTGV